MLYANGKPVEEHHLIHDGGFFGVDPTIWMVVRDGFDALVLRRERDGVKHQISVSVPNGTLPPMCVRVLLYPLPGGKAVFEEVKDPPSPPVPESVGFMGIAACLAASNLLLVTFTLCSGVFGG